MSLEARSAPPPPQRESASCSLEAGRRRQDRRGIEGESWGEYGSSSYAQGGRDSVWEAKVSHSSSKDSMWQAREPFKREAKDLPNDRTGGARGKATTTGEGRARSLLECLFTIMWVDDTSPSMPPVKPCSGPEATCSAVARIATCAEIEIEVQQSPI
ncbi:hypothetical protein Dda_7008 [Drechslerella dactyloides]|uniref:Uncharacterized protein n=1 Tax=Drechslerella dactyloides TaxID=74499 RepID=A0AAD6ISZ3_DREDA|nr:hypothetical protein Dda_7008 [Drechslerella dactyloides]